MRDVVDALAAGIRVARERIVASSVGIVQAVLDQGGDDLALGSHVEVAADDQG